MQPPSVFFLQPLLALLFFLPGSATEPRTRRGRESTAPSGARRRGPPPRALGRVSSAGARAPHPDRQRAPRPPAARGSAARRRAPGAWKRARRAGLRGEPGPPAPLARPVTNERPGSDRPMPLPWGRGTPASETLRFNGAGLAGAADGRRRRVPPPG